MAAFLINNGLRIVGAYSIEACKESDMDECPKELIRFSHLIKGGISAAEFLEEYSNGNIH